jgi:hypothetical protein
VRGIAQRRGRPRFAPLSSGIARLLGDPAREQHGVCRRKRPPHCMPATVQQLARVPTVALHAGPSQVFGRRLVRGTSRVSWAEGLSPRPIDQENCHNSHISNTENAEEARVGGHESGRNVF